MAGAFSLYAIPHGFNLKAQEKNRPTQEEVKPTKNQIKSSTVGGDVVAGDKITQNIILQPNNASKSLTAFKENPQDRPIKNFASRYTLAADMTISTDHVHVNGINVLGNVNVNDSEGVEFRKMKIFKAEEKSKGKINIDRSQEFSIKENVVENEINVDRSKSFNVEKNTVGEIADRDRQAQEKINTILLETSCPEEIMSSLIIIQELISEDEVLANALGERVQILDKENNGKYKAIIINHLEKLEVNTLQKAEDSNIGLVFHWLDFFMHFNEK
ncbi:MAG: hypothetical protein A2321_02395 [Omnitrophica WOR_2 bacterium RIFOXYB2_FULL_45_11]|nr:MAG: hypothetical protein A2321_02395 [Omnitrophica WOR_2 bacterium RIFOXYB2_FULL_45_11]